MGIRDLTRASAEAVVDDAGLALITFAAPGCGACRAFAPTFEACSTRHPDIVFGRVDTRRESDLARAFDVRSVPATAVLREQVLLLMQPGAISENALEGIIARARALDMDELRREIAAEADEPETGT